MERLCGSFPKPEKLAYNRSELPAQPLYRVRFMQMTVWPDYAGADPDTINIEIYQTEAQLAALVTRGSMIGIAWAPASLDFMPRRRGGSSRRRRAGSSARRVPRRDRAGRIRDRRAVSSGYTCTG
jgi:hypothetical protein